MFYDQYDNENFEQTEEEEVKQFIGTSKTINIYEDELDDIKIGDKIAVYFYPHSQKYLFLLYPKYGEVINIKKSDNDQISLDDIILKNNYNEYNANHDGVGIYSYSRGFDVIIKKITND
jgi:hypothetical protein